MGSQGEGGKNLILFLQMTKMLPKIEEKSKKKFFGGEGGLGPKGGQKCQFSIFLQMTKMLAKIEDKSKKIFFLGGGVGPKGEPKMSIFYFS